MSDKDIKGLPPRMQLFVDESGLTAWDATFHHIQVSRGEDEHRVLTLQSGGKTTRFVLDAEARTALRTMLAD